MRAKVGFLRGERTFETSDVRARVGVESEDTEDVSLIKSLLSTEGEARVCIKPGVSMDVEERIGEGARRAR